MKNWLELLIVALLICVIGFTFFAMYQEKKSCDDQGGTLVRGLFWYECLDRK